MITNIYIGYHVDMIINISHREMSKINGYILSLLTRLVCHNLFLQHLCITASRDNSTVDSVYMQQIIFNI